MRIDILTVVPELLESPLGYSIVGRARKKGLVEIYVHNVRKYGIGPRKTVDVTLLQSHLCGFFGSKVQLSCTAKGKGKISIPFNNEEDLERIMEILDSLKKKE